MKKFVFTSFFLNFLKFYVYCFGRSDTSFLQFLSSRIQICNENSSTMHIREILQCPTFTPACPINVAFPGAIPGHKLFFCTKPLTNNFGTFFGLKVGQGIGLYTTNGHLPFKSFYQTDFYKNVHFVQFLPHATLYIYTTI